MKTMKLLIAGLVFSTGTIFSAEMPKGWFPAGSHPKEYEMGLDRNMTHAGKASGTLKSIVPQASGFGTLMQMCNADKYRGKRVRMSGFVRSVGVADWAGLWFRVDGVNGEMLSFDNMENRSLTGTLDWQQYEIVLDVPKNSQQLAFGVLLSGTGQVWIDDLKFEVVGTNVPTTSVQRAVKETAKANIPSNPVNLGFED